MPGPGDEGVEREVVWGKNIPASAEQAKEEVKYVSGRRAAARCRQPVLAATRSWCAMLHGAGCTSHCYGAGTRDGWGAWGTAVAWCSQCNTMQCNGNQHQQQPHVPVAPFALPPLPPPQAGQGLADSVEMGVNVLLSKAKDAAAQVKRAVGMESERGPEMSHGGMGAAGKMEHAPPGTKSGFNRWEGLQGKEGPLACLGPASDWEPPATGACQTCSSLPVSSPASPPSPMPPHCSGPLSEDLARAKYEEIAGTEKPAFPEGEQSVNEMVSRLHAATSLRPVGR